MSCIIGVEAADHVGKATAKHLKERGYSKNVSSFAGNTIHILGAAAVLVLGLKAFDSASKST